MNIRKIELFEFQRLAPQITELLTHSRQNNIFLTPEWLITWWEFWAGDAELYVLIAEHDQQIVGMAPLMRQKQRFLGVMEMHIISFLNTQVAADHIDFVSHNNMETPVNQAFFSYLTEHQQDWDILCLDDLPQLSQTVSDAEDFFPRNYQISKRAGQLCPYLPLSNETETETETEKENAWDNYLSQKSKNFRQQTRAKRRKFENKLGGQYIQCQSKEQLHSALSRLADLNPERWNNKGETSSFSNTQFQAFHLKIAETFLHKGWLDLAYLEVDGSIVAVIYNYTYGNKVFYYNTAFDMDYSRYSAGRVLMGYSIENAFANGMDEFDFLRGVHSYKYEWSELQRENHDLIVFKKTLKALFWNTIQQAKLALRQFLKKHLSSGLKFKIKSLIER